MIPGLDGLRALAFLAVLGGHTNNYSFGWVGVQLFFVLSGFLITGILVRMKASLPRKDYFVKFYGRRFLRIFPLYYLYLGILIAVNLALPHIAFKPLHKEFDGKFWEQIWFAVSYLYDFFHASAAYEPTRFLTPLWSLSVEEQFYVLWPLLIFLTPAKRQKGLFLAVIGLGPLFRLLLKLFYMQRPFAFMLDDPTLALYVLPFSHIDAFAMGAYISQCEIPRPRLQTLLLFIFVPLVGFYTQSAAWGEIRWDSLGYEFPLQVAYKEIWGYSLLNYFFAVTIYSVARTRLLTTLLDSFILRYLGKISYGLYIYHGAVIWFTLKLNLPFDLATWQMFAFTLAAATLVASLSFYLFEKPINDLKDKFFPV
ncbi:MAG: acyltransferase family protein [Chloroflexota bacterium]